MLNLFYQLTAPSSTSQESLHQFLEETGRCALQLGLSHAHVMDCTFDSPEKKDFARRICILPEFSDDRLQQSDFTSDPFVSGQSRFLGTCRVLPSAGTILVIRSKEGLESVFGFLRFPREIVGGLDTGHSTVIEHPIGDGWSFSQSISSSAPEYRHLLQRFDEAGYLEFLLDEHANEGSIEV